MRTLKNIMVTGGCGFIGSNFIRYLFDRTGFSGRVINVDSLTYAGNPESLKDIDARLGGDRYIFEHRDIRNYEDMSALFSSYDIDTVIHFAAESHVDRSIYGPREFIETNIVGTFTLLEAARHHWGKRDDVLFHHVSTDEVFGSLGPEGFFVEETPYDPRSPYSASKASSDHLVRAAYHTFGFPITLSNCSNNYGPYQFPEKLIPLMIMNILEEKPLPVYGEGKNIRDWLYVEDHAIAIWTIVTRGSTGSTYNVGGDNEWTNIDLVNLLCEEIAAIKGREKDYYKKLITYVPDRPGHDMRYAIDCSRIKRELGWNQEKDFMEYIRLTIRWYIENEEWVDRIRSGEYKKWLEKNYSERN